ncbi:hypothetical protein, partial [Cognatishimia activa]|uniref:hypothetical protein n=1 Tax=Cognatishimia activa TaxID=1715691 RepID=UPI001C6FCAFB
YVKKRGNQTKNPITRDKNQQKAPNLLGASRVIMLDIVTKLPLKSPLLSVSSGPSSSPLAPQCLTQRRR